MTAGPVTLLFTDLVGSTELAQRLGEAGAEAFRRTHFALLRNAFAPYGGREVKNLGDGLMVVFDAPSDAVASAVAMQRAVAEHNRSGGEPFAVRVGVQSGEAVQEDGDYFGTPVVVAKRLCDRACANQILSTAAVAALVTGTALVLRPVGDLALKGLAEPVAAVEAMWDGLARTPEPAKAAPVRVVRPPSLAPPPDPFVGRDAELTALAGVLQRNRLVSLIGPGGVGKTRLSGHLVDVVAGRYPDGAWCCALAPVGRDAEVADAVATALHVERRAGTALAERVVEFLAPKRALLVLDNCEQVVDGAADLTATLLAGTTSVDILVTSREALGLPGEHRFRLDPLALEADDGAPAPAVSLFLERVAATGRQVEEGALAQVLELCRRVDGLPLAIELAAAQAAGRTIPEILTDVTERLADLSVRRGRAERHRSIHALVDWSYELLDAADRRLFERMATFAGGAEAEAVADVAALDLRTAVDRLQGLADRSMVATRAIGGATRYGLLVPVKAYAEQRLSEAERSAARDAHARYFVDLAERADADLRVPGSTTGTLILDAEMPNLRAAQAWLLEAGSAEGALRLAAAMFWFGWNGMVSETQAWAEQSVEAFAGSGHPRLPAAYATAACGAWLRGDLRRAAELVGRGFEAEAASGVRCSELLQIAGNVAIHRGEFDRSAAFYDRTAAAAREAGDPVGEICGLGSAGMARCYGGRAAEARRLVDLHLELAESHRGDMLRSMAYYMAGESRLDSAPAEAAPHLERSIELAARIGNRFNVGTSGLSLLGVRARLGDPGTALPRYPELIEHWQRAGVWNQLWMTLRNLIEALGRSGYPEPAAVLYGAMAASGNSPPLSGPDAVRVHAVLAAAADEIGRSALTAHQERGAGLDDAGAVAYAHQVLREILDGT